MSRLHRLAGTALALCGSAAALADPPVILSASPNKVAVTIYRSPDRGGDEPIDKANPAAFALIAETRTIDLPPGVVTVRFEGVAGGIVPQSAILFGTDPRERNRDAALLSQKGLVDAYTGQQVTLRRTDPATGKVTEERGRILSAANRLVLQTAQGAEAVYCTGLAQTLLYPSAPASLSAKPVLTMTTKDQPGGKATVTLAYLATGFDWDATYVGTLAPDGRSLGLFAWLTMASADETSFVDATTSAVAGRVNRASATQDDNAMLARDEASFVDRTSKCWPAGTTSDVDALPPLMVAPPPQAPMFVEMAMPDMAVAASRMEVKGAMAPAAVVAVSEGLGDLKLYRIPVPVTVAARSQKQVAFLNKPEIKGMLVARAIVMGGAPGGPELLFRFTNRKESGLGEPFPAGKAVFYQESRFGRQLVGQSSVTDKAVGEEVELTLAAAKNVTLQTAEENMGKATRHRVTLRNANPFPVAFELEFRAQPYVKLGELPKSLKAKPGKQVWQITLPPGSTRTVAYLATPVG